MLTHAPPFIQMVMTLCVPVAALLLLLSLGIMAPNSQRVRKLAREGLAILAGFALIVFYLTSRQPHDSTFWLIVAVSITALIGETINAMQRFGHTSVTAGKFFMTVGVISTLMIVIRLY